MFVKNTSNKPMGFGAVVILPDEIKELPKGFGPDHPTVKFFLLKNWLVQVDEAQVSDPWQLTPEQKAAKAAADAEKAAAKAAAEAEAAKAKALEEAARKKAELDVKVAALGKMNLEELRKEAAAAGIACADGDTKAVIAQKIAEKLQAEAR